ncbi:MAG: hypothetical protein RL333_1800 [Pseudomonadota bacterium]|jgi:hypothetical protein
MGTVQKPCFLIVLVLCLAGMTGCAGGYPAYGAGYGYRPYYGYGGFGYPYYGGYYGRYGGWNHGYYGRGGWGGRGWGGGGFHGGFGGRR